MGTFERIAGGGSRGGGRSTEADAVSPCPGARGSRSGSGAGRGAPPGGGRRSPTGGRGGGRRAVARHLKEGGMRLATLISRALGVPVIALAAAGLPARAGPAAAQDTRPGIAVLRFENGGSYGKDREEFEALRKGIAAMLISELAQNPGVRLVDRAETQRLLDEQGLAVAERV